MSAFWIRFMKEHRTLLLESAFLPEEPQNMYPLITASNGAEALSCVYARDRVVTLPEGVRHFYLANATRCSHTMLRTTADKNAHIVVRNCKGEITSEFDQCLSQTVLCIHTPVAGLVEITVEE